MVLCFGKAKWKKEFVVDHKFDYLNIEEFKSNDCGYYTRYFFVYLLVLRAVFIYISDFVSVFLQFYFLKSITFTNNLLDYTKWIYLFCMLVSLLLLYLDYRKAKKIIKSRDISFAFTNRIAYRYYCLRDYHYFCFFEEINDQKKFKDQLALFVFFTLKNWKRIVFAELPRNAINAFTLYQTIKAFGTMDPTKWNAPLFTTISLLSIAFVLMLFCFSLFAFFLAAALYIPLICEIRGNLKEYCCHKIDKRIGQLIKRNEHEKKMIAEVVEMKRMGNKRQEMTKMKLLGLQQPQSPILPLSQQSSLAPVQQLGRIPPSYQSNSTRSFGSNSSGHSIQKQSQPLQRQLQQQQQSKYYQPQQQQQQQQIYYDDRKSQRFEEEVDEYMMMDDDYQFNYPPPHQSRAFP